MTEIRAVRCLGEMPTSREQSIHLLTALRVKKHTPNVRYQTDGDRYHFSCVGRLVARLGPLS